MRRLVFSVIFVLIISSTLMPIFPLLISININANESGGETNKLHISAVTEITTPIVIDDLPGSLTNWTWAKDQGYCTGLGTQSSPYIISENFFNTSTLTTDCLTIVNSRKYFTVRDCEFKGNFNFAGIKLYNTTNGVITENFMYYSTGALVWLFNASYNVVRNNNASGGSYYGVLIDGTGGRAKMNVVSDNLITYNIVGGVEIRGGLLNTVSNNYMFNNTIGVKITAFTWNITIRGNHIGNSSSVGLLIDPMSQYHEIFENCNSWDNGVKGNYWDNYTGLDANSDGIGDIPYNITGAGDGRDNFPLMSCPVPPSTPGIPGYDVFLVLFIREKRKSKTNME
ncbi:MAG: right-handed parallel beta-helix repeat-containing protein [Promethearchaeota archaeon]